MKTANPDAASERRTAQYNSFKKNDRKEIRIKLTGVKIPAFKRSSNLALGLV